MGSQPGESVSTVTGTLRERKRQADGLTVMKVLSEAQLIGEVTPRWLAPPDASSQPCPSQARGGAEKRCGLWGHCCVGRKQDNFVPTRHVDPVCESGKVIYLGRSDSLLSDGDPCRKAQPSLNATVPAKLLGTQS